MEEFLLKRRQVHFEMWQLGLAILAAVLVLVGFGALVAKAASNERHAGPVSGAALAIARIPSDTKDVIGELIENKHPDLVGEQRFDGQSGFEIVSPQDPTGDLLLLARFDGDRRRSVTEIVDVDTGETLHTYTPDIKHIQRLLKADEAKAGEARDPNMNIVRDHRPKYYGIYHPFIEDDGDLIFKAIDTPLVKVNVCSGVEWTRYGAFHHAIERAADGTYWTAGRLIPQSLALTTSDFEDDSIVQFSTDGEILFQKPVSQILIDNDMAHLVYMGRTYDLDPFHLNDVQPVLSDGPYWQQGDLLVSLRNRSVILLYRPETNEIVWSVQGPWIMQHDVDIVSDHAFSVFSNNTFAHAYGLRVRGGNQRIVYDLEEAAANKPLEDAFKALDIRTVFQGLNEQLPNGDVFVEETEMGRSLLLGPDGEVKWTYVNRAGDGRIYHLQWSRYLPAEQAAPIRALLKNGVDCTSQPEDT